MRHGAECTRPRAYADHIEENKRSRRRDRVGFGLKLAGAAGVGITLALLVLSASDRDEPSNLVGITEDTPPPEMPGIECMEEERAAGNIVEGSTSDAVRAAEFCIGTMINGRQPDPIEVRLLAGVFSNPDQP